VDYIFICGRYEGIDQRVIENDVDEVWSIGDFVLSGGEMPAMVMMDAIARLLRILLLKVCSITGIIRALRISKVNRCLKSS